MDDRRIFRLTVDMCSWYSQELPLVQDNWRPGQLYQNNIFVLLRASVDGNFVWYYQQGGGALRLQTKFPFLAWNACKYLFSCAVHPLCILYGQRYLACIFIVIHIHRNVYYTNRDTNKSISLRISQLKI